MENNTNNDIVNVIEAMKQPKKLLDDKFQKKLIKVIIEDDQFAKEIIDMLNEEYFEGILPVTIINYILNYYEKYSSIPNYETLTDVINSKESDDNTKNHLIEFLKLTQDYKLADKQFVKDYTKNFCKKQSLKRGLEDAAKAWEKEDYESIHKIIMDSMKAGDHKEIGHDYTKDVEKRLLKSVRNPVPILDGIDHRIGGGLAAGELGVILSPTGGGKSMMLVRFACTALMHGKTVVYYSMELFETVVANRFDSCLTGHKLTTILNYPNVIREKTKEIEDLGGKLIVREFGTGTASVNSLRAHIKQLERDGIIPDVIFVDYADIMKATSNFQEKRFALTSIYESLRALAMELALPIWTASQAGRCLEINTLVETSSGKIKICDLKINNEILTSEGYKKVTHTTPIQKQTCYKITTKSGKEIIVSERHIFPVEGGELKSIESGLDVGHKLYIKSHSL